MPTKERKRPRLHHIPVDGLNVPSSWQVGKVVFRPPGWLARQAERRLPLTPSTWPNGFAEWVAADIEKLDCATAQVAARIASEAHDVAREAVAVLRLFQRARYPRVNSDAQTFGLRGDLDSWVMPYFVGSTRTPFVGGWTRGGVHVDWTFHKDDPAAFRSDPVFQFLSAALRKQPSDRTDFERRAISAISVRHLAVASRPDALRIPFVAVTIETLLGDTRSRDKAHRIAQRVAYLTCHGECGRSSPACFYQRAADWTGIEEQIGIARSTGSHGLCSAYWHIRNVFDARVESLHEARLTFEKDQVHDLQHWTDAVVIDVLAWIVNSGATGLSDLTASLDAAVAQAGGPIRASKECRTRTAQAGSTLV